MKMLKIAWPMQVHTHTHQKGAKVLGEMRAIHVAYYTHKSFKIRKKRRRIRLNGPEKLRAHQLISLIKEGINPNMA